MDAVILNYKAGRMQQFANAMHRRFTAKKGIYEVVFSGNGWRQEGAVNTFHDRGPSWSLIIHSIARWIVLNGHENEDLSILIKTYRPEGLQ